MDAGQRHFGESLAGRLPGQVVLVLQGGGALGSYQAGVYEALHEAGVEPDWIIGTSIGAINASLIAGNEPHERGFAAVRELASYGCQTHVVRLLAPQLDRETHTKDIDFSTDGIRQRWEAGSAHTRSVLEREPWIGEFDPLAAVVFHEHMELMPRAAE
jgi:predicted acylesterase/phospholipase RssA